MTLVQLGVVVIIMLRVVLSTSARQATTTNADLTIQSWPRTRSSAHTVTVDVTKYGATGDGVTDDGAALET